MIAGPAAPRTDDVSATRTASAPGGTGIDPGFTVCAVAAGASRTRHPAISTAIEPVFMSSIHSSCPAGGWDWISLITTVPRATGERGRVSRTSSIRTVAVVPVAAGRKCHRRRNESVAARAPQFLEMVQIANKKKIYTATSTNAHYLTDENAKKTIESGLDRLIISIDGTSQETYQQYRVGGNLNKVLEGTKNIVKWKTQLKSSTPHIIFQFLVVKPNEHQIDEVKTLAKELGVDEVLFKTAQIYDYEQGSPLIPSIERYSRYTQNTDGSYSIKNKLLNHCWKMWHSCVITWDGAVVPCCFDKDAEYKMGTIANQTFSQIWQSLPYQNFRKSLIQSRSSIEMCKNCTEGMAIWG